MLTFISFSGTPGTSTVTSRASFVSATLIAGTPAPTRNEGKCRSSVRNMSSISRRNDLNGIRSWLLDHKLGSFIGAVHRSPNCDNGLFCVSQPDVNGGDKLSHLCPP